MSKKIYLLTDYKEVFSNKHKSKPYRSGYDKKLLIKYFKKYGYATVFLKFTDINFEKYKWNNEIILYTSSEEIGGNYKDYIEDIVYALELSGAKVLPSYKYLRAHNNKVFMEILRQLFLPDHLFCNAVKHFGSLEDLIEKLSNSEISFPCVIKSSKGAQSKGVALARNKEELLKNAKKLSRTPNRLYEIRDKLRSYKMRGYRPESRHQKKFIVQPFIKGLSNDYKVLIYGNIYFVLLRKNRPNDFRASGSGLFSPCKKDQIPKGMLDDIENIFSKLDIPFLSVDYAFSDGKGYLLEMQAIHFGNSTKTIDQEEVYVQSVINYLKRDIND